MSGFTGTAHVTQYLPTFPTCMYMPAYKLHGHTHIHTCTLTCTCTHLHTCTCTYLHIYIHALYISTYMHMYIPDLLVLCLEHIVVKQPLFRRTALVTPPTVQHHWSTNLQGVWHRSPYGCVTIVMCVCMFVCDRMFIITLLLLR